ncbi:unnamed protein product [Rhizoctonia solani]|uniref:VWFA domain-containing protein n=1 Tax=Rhizoctonia solani TaxID=456999 RepID=A0A8H3H8B5_9AGAM|nr:unnamed protein product [Rhizoctonia solani]
MLEATILLIDNSEYMRNGDYQPSRFGAQADAVNVVFTSKTDANPESTVGLMTLAGKAPEVLVTPTTNHGKILSALHQTKIGGSVDLATGLNVAQLALKHRQNKNQRQRIIVFLGSPLDTDEKSLVRLAKKLKKNNVAVDVVSFGEEDLNDALLRVFVDTLNSSDNRQVCYHLLSIPSGANMLISDAILSSPILAGDDGVPPGAMGGEASGSNQFEFGVDPSLDPELAMALRISMEEERARQAVTGTSGAAAPSLPQVPESVEPTSQAAQETVPSMDEDEEDALLAQALALSQDQGDAAMESGESNEMDEDLNEEEEIARAIEMSVKEEEEQNKDKAK